MTNMLGRTTVDRPLLVLNGGLSSAMPPRNSSAVASQSATRAKRKARASSATRIAEGNLKAGKKSSKSAAKKKNPEEMAVQKLMRAHQHLLQQAELRRIAIEALRGQDLGCAPDTLAQGLAAVHIPPHDHPIQDGGGRLEAESTPRSSAELSAPEPKTDIGTRSSLKEGNRSRTGTSVSAPSPSEERASRKNRHTPSRTPSGSVQPPRRSMRSSSPATCDAPPFRTAGMSPLTKSKDAVKGVNDEDARDNRFLRGQSSEASRSVGRGAGTGSTRKARMSQGPMKWLQDQMAAREAEIDSLRLDLIARLAVSESTLARLEARAEAEARAARRAEDAAQQMQMHLTLTVKKLAKVEQAQAQLERDSAAQVRELHARCQLLEDRLRLKDTLPVSSKQLEQLEGKVGEFAKTFGSPQAALTPTACTALAEQNREGGLSQDVLNRLQKQKEQLLRQTSGRAPAEDGGQDCGDSGGEDRQCSGAQGREQRETGTPRQVAEGDTVPVMTPAAVEGVVESIAVSPIRARPEPSSSNGTKSKSTPHSLPILVDTSHYHSHSGDLSTNVSSDVRTSDVWTHGRGVDAVHEEEVEVLLLQVEQFARRAKAADASLVSLSPGAGSGSGSDELQSIRVLHRGLVQEHQGLCDRAKALVATTSASINITTSSPASTSQWSHVSIRNRIKIDSHLEATSKLLASMRATLLTHLSSSTASSKAAPAESLRQYARPWEDISININRVGDRDRDTDSPTVGGVDRLDAPVGARSDRESKARTAGAQV